MDAELIATKIRALYQRKKGRDLFYMWLGITELGLYGGAVVVCVRPVSASRAVSLRSLP